MKEAEESQWSTLSLPLILFPIAVKENITTRLLLRKKVTRKKKLKADNFNDVAILIL